MASRKTWIAAALAAAALAAAALAVALWLRGRGASGGDPYDEPYARLRDPEYKKQLKVQEDGQKEIMRRMAAVRAEIDALGDETNTPRWAELRRKLVEEAGELEKNRILTLAIIRERKQREDAAVKEKQDNLKQKGK